MGSELKALYQEISQTPSREAMVKITATENGYLAIATPKNLFLIAVDLVE